MNCELAQEDIVLSVYGELADERAHPLEQHLAQCERCRREMETVAALQKAMTAEPPEEPSPSLIARSRLRLDEALDAMPHSGLLLRIAQRFRRGFATLGSVPVAASVLLIMGLAAGGYGGYRIALRNAVAAPAPNARAINTSADLDSAQVAGVSDITIEPGTENVEVRFERVIPETTFGTLDDPQIRQLLLLGARERFNPAVHDDSVNLLARECQAGHECNGAPIRNALMVALRYDRDAGVRRKALEGLESYIGVDTRVRDAILEALLHDPDAGVRTEAIGMLEPVEADAAVRDVLETLSQDQNPAIRTASRQYLEQVSQIQ